MKFISSSPFLSLLLIPALVVSPLGAQAPLAVNAPRSGDVVLVDAQNSAPVGSDLQIRLVESTGPDVKTNSQRDKGLTVAVTNASGAAVADAAVTVRLPDSGPTGTFTDGSHAAVAYSDAQGQAHFADLHWTQTPGSVALRVTATKGNSHAALLLQENLTANSATLVQVPASPAQSAPAIPQPGQTATAQPLTRSGAAPRTSTPAPLGASATAAKPQPSVSVTGASPDASQHSGKTKWIILAAVVAAAAGAGVAVAGKGKASSAPTASGLTIGTPTVSVGAPH